MRAVARTRTLSWHSQPRFYTYRVYRLKTLSQEIIVSNADVYYEVYIICLSDLLPPFYQISGHIEHVSSHTGSGRTSFCA
jgi:hypothetical protein